VSIKIRKEQRIAFASDPDYELNAEKTKAMSNANR